MRGQYVAGSVGCGGFSPTREPKRSENPRLTLPGQCLHRKSLRRELVVVNRAKGTDLLLGIVMMRSTTQLGNPDHHRSLFQDVESRQFPLGAWKWRRSARPEVVFDVGLYSVLKAFQDRVCDQ